MNECEYFQLLYFELLSFFEKIELFSLVCWKRHSRQIVYVCREFSKSNCSSIWWDTCLPNFVLSGIGVGSCFPGMFSVVSSRLWVNRLWVNRLSVSCIVFVSQLEKKRHHAEGQWQWHGEMWSRLSLVLGDILRPEWRICLSLATSSIAIISVNIISAHSVPITRKKKTFCSNVSKQLASFDSIRLPLVGFVSSSPSSILRKLWTTNNFVYIYKKICVFLKI